MEEQEGQAAKQSDYWCFLSYRHADNKAQDRDWASWLHHEIERYEVPAELVGTTNGRGDVLPERIYPVFRDEESLPADADLANTIVNALNRSRFMVVLCSPRAVESEYVAQEVQHFKKSGKSDRIIAAILDGEPGDAERECFPMPLRHPLGREGELEMSQNVEPIAADFRLRDGSQGFTSSQAYRLRLAKDGSVTKRHVRELADHYEGQLQLMKLKIIAGVLGVPLEQLRDRDKAYQLELAQKRARTLRAWLAGVALLAVLAIILGFLAEQNRKSALIQKGIAETEADRATRARIISDRQTLSALTSTSQVLLRSGDQIEALRNAVEAGSLLKEVPELAVKNVAWYEALIALQKAVYETREINRLPTGKTWGSRVVFTDDNRSIVMADTGRGLIKRWNIDGRELSSFESGHYGAMDVCSDISHFDLSADGETLVTVGTQGDVKFWGADDQPAREGYTVPTEGGGDCTSISGVHVDFENDQVIVIDQAGTVSWWNPRGEKLKEFKAAPVAWLRSGAAFSPRGTHLATYKDGNVLLWDLAATKLLTGENVPEADFLQFDETGESLWVATRTGVMRRIALDGKMLAKFGPAEGTFTDEKTFAICFSASPGGGPVACGASTGELTLWTPEGDLIDTFEPHPGQLVGSVRFSADGSRFATAGVEGSEIRIWESKTEPSPAPDPEGSDKVLTDQRVSPDGRVVASIGGDYRQLIELRDRDGKLLASFDAGQLPNADFVTGVLNVSVSPGGDLVASGGVDGTVKLWDLKGTLVRTINAHRDYARAWFSPEGGILLTINDTGKDSGNFDGRAELKLWTLEGRQLATLLPGIAVTEAGFAADGTKLIAVGEGEGETQVWNFDLDDLLERGARRLRAYLGTRDDDGVTETETSR